MILTDVNELRGLSSSNPAKAKQEASQQFESIFTYQMLKAMADTVPDNEGILEDDASSKLYKDMFYMEAAKTISQGQGLGIASIAQEQLQKLENNR